MARRVNELLKSQKRRRALGDNARKKLLSRFTFEFTAPQILSVCRTVAGKKPAVSVIVPNYNHARFLPERLDSIFNQTCRDFEVILLDDASSDASMEVLEQYRDRADVRIVRNECNSGSTFKQWLKGIELARADVLWVAESDDRCEPDFIASLLPAFQNPNVKLAYANSHVIDEAGAVVGDYTGTDYLRSLSPTKWTRSYTVSAEQEINDGLGVKNTILSASAVLFRKFALTQDVRNRLEGMRIAGDWYFIVHAIAGGEVHYESRNLSHHRRHSESVVGKLLQQNRVNDFFREFYTVHSAIFGRYRLVNGFPMHWEKYLTDQWAAFFPDRPFDELNDYYPVERAREQIIAALAQSKP
jgi:glycosyltransferase involved in cell wall biosynthesis